MMDLSFIDLSNTPLQAFWGGGKVDGKEVALVVAWEQVPGCLDVHH